MTSASLYCQVVGITQEYLGPAAERFTERIVSFHLHKKPEELTREDIAQIAQWVKVLLGHLTDQQAVVTECEAKLLSLKIDRLSAKSS